jgi:hypothetical protein
MPRPAVCGFAAALVAVSAGAALAQDDWPRDTTYHGPMRYCSQFYAIEVPATEQVTVRDPGLDFLVTYFESDGQGIGVYEGNHPQTTDKKPRRVRLMPGIRVDRLTDRNEKVSYLILAKEGDIPVYLHVFSDRFRGGDSDRAILERFSVGDFDKTGCSRATYAEGN